MTWERYTALAALARKSVRHAASTRRLLAACASAIAITACSGGGSGGPVPPAAAPSQAAAPATSPSPSASSSARPGTSPSPGASSSAGPGTSPSAGPGTSPSATPGVGGTTPAPTPTPSNPGAPTATPSQQATSLAFAGWSTYGYDNHRDGFNPNTTAITPASIGQLHLAWQANYADFNTQSQPVLAANIPGHRAVIFVGGGSGNVYAYDGTTGSQMWKTFLGQIKYTCDPSGSGFADFGIGGTVVYDAGSQSIFVPANSNTSVGGPAKDSIVRLSAANGSQIGQIDAAANPLTGELNFTHTSLALANGRVYLGTSAACDRSSWRGRVAAADINLTNVQTFFTAWSPSLQYSGGGVWGEGGVAVDDAGNVYTGVGNADTNYGTAAPQPPFVQAPNETAGYGENFIKLAPDLSAVRDNNAPGFNGVDLDLNGSPVLFTPLGCSDTLAALQGKAGQLLTYDTQQIANGPVSRLQISPSTYDSPYLGNPGYSPVTGLMYAGVETGSGGIPSPGMLAYKPSGCNGATTLSLVWRAAFGPDSYTGGVDLPRSAVSVTAGGVVFVGTPCTADGNGGCQSTASSAGGAVWALDAATGSVLNGGKPLVITGDIVRMAPVIDSNWVFVTDNSANLYAFTTDASVTAKQATRTYANRPFSLTRFRHR